MFNLLKNLPLIPDLIVQTVLYGTGEREEQTRITADTRWWLAEQHERNGAECASLRAEVQRLQAAVVRLTTERDALDDEAMKWPSIAGRAAEEIEQLRADLAHARNQLPGTPGQTVTLHLENGTTTTGRLEVHHNQRTVRGLLVDVVGRSVVVVPDGGEA